MGYSPPVGPGSPGKGTQADDLDAQQRGQTGTGFDPAYMAQPWDRAMEVMTSEPVRGMAPDSGTEGCPPWTQTTLHGSSTGRISVQAGDAATAGRWPISGGAIHSHPGENTKDGGGGLEKGTAPYFDQMGY